VPADARLGIMTALAGEDGHSLAGRATGVSVSGIVGKIVLSAICDQQTSSAALKWDVARMEAGAVKLRLANPEWGYERPPSNRLFRLPFLPFALSGDGRAAIGTTLGQL
jgi:hypothetical protein